MALWNRPAAGAYSAASSAGAGAARRARLLRALRKAHAWIGLWGATLGLLFGITGFLLNHRAVMKIPAAQYERNTVHVALPDARPASPRALGEWLLGELDMPGRGIRTSVERAQTVHWNDRPVAVPEKWSISLDGTRDLARAEYYAGDRFVKVERIHANWIAALSNTHKGVGAGVAWVLLADAVAGSLVLLSLSGIFMWGLLYPLRRLAAGIAVSGMTLAVLLGLSML